MRGRRLTTDFLEAVATRDPSLPTSNIDVSVENHVMGCEADGSRKTNTVRLVRV